MLRYQDARIVLRHHLNVSASPKATSPSGLLPRLAAGVIASLLLWFSSPGLFAYLTGDDMMNIYGAWQKPYYRILLENVFYFTPGYRPMGSLVYRLLFDIAGINAFPFRVVCFLLLLSNLYLLYRTAAAASSREAGFLAALFASYNTGFIDLYYNTGTIYDLLCFAFYFWALGLYVNVRKRGHFLNSRTLIAFLALYVCALNSKEMAVTLPVVLFGYELILGRSGQGPQTGRRLIARWGPPVLSAVMAVPFVFGKFAASSPLMGNEAYRVHLGVRTYLRALAHYLEIFTLPPGSLSLASAALVLVLLGIIAILGRRRSLVFAWFFILVTLLPVAFIDLRGGYAIYIPTFGMALFLAVVIVESRKALARLIAGPGGALALQTRRLLQVDTFLFCLLALFVFHNSRPLGGISADDKQLQSFAGQIHNVQPKIDSTWRVLFLDDPFPSDSWAPLFILRLHYRAPDLIVNRIKTMSEKPNRNEIDAYDCIFTLDGQRLVRVKP